MCFPFSPHSYICLDENSKNCFERFTYIQCYFTQYFCFQLYRNCIFYIGDLLRDVLRGIYILIDMFYHFLKNQIFVFSFRFQLTIFDFGEYYYDCFKHFSIYNMLYSSFFIVFSLIFLSCIKNLVLVDLNYGLWCPNFFH